MSRKGAQYCRDAPLGSEAKRAWGAIEFDHSPRTRRGVVGCCDKRHRGYGRRGDRGLGRASATLHQGKRREARPEVVNKSGIVAREARTPCFREVRRALVSPGGEAAHQTRRAGFTMAARPQPALAGRERGHPQGVRLAVRGERECGGRASVGGVGALCVSQGAADGAEVCQAWQRMRMGVGRHAGRGGVGQLAMLRARVKFGTAQKGSEKALDTAAGQAGMPLLEIEEISVPAYGLQEVGVRRAQVGEFGVELVVTGTTATELRWIKPDGKRQKSVPKAVKEHTAEDLKEIKAAATDLRKMLPAQRDRIENLYLEQKSWMYPAWRERYLDHPVVGTLARRLIWKFTNEERTGAGVFYNGRIVGRDGHVLDWFDDSTSVALWHPMLEEPGEVLAWRGWLAELEIRQPFKQAHREVYLLTDAERTTRTYSNRFAAHVIKQHQFNALCAARGWKNKLRLM